jgi:hypothetical protein
VIYPEQTPPLLHKHHSLTPWYSGHRSATPTSMGYRPRGGCLPLDSERTESGRVYVFSGARRPAFLINGAAVNDRFDTVFPGEDQNGRLSGYATVRRARCPPQPDTSEIWSGADGSLIRHISVISDRWFGFSRARRRFQSHGVPTSLCAPQSTQSSIAVGSVTILSGADGSRLATWYGTTAGAFFGYSVGAPGDVDGDGKPDVLVGVRDDSPSGASSGSVRVLCTRDGGTILRFDGNSASDRMGWSCAAGDVNADGLADFLVGAPGDLPGGHVQVWSRCPIPTRSYCVSAPNSQTFGALIGSTGSTSVTQNNLAVTVVDAIANSPDSRDGSTQVTMRRLRCGRSTFRLGPPQTSEWRWGNITLIDLTLPPFNSDHWCNTGSLRFFQYWYRNILGPAGPGSPSQ